MKLTFILLTAALLQVSAKGLSQKITFSGTNVPIHQVFAAVEKQTGYVFFYRADDINLAKPVTVDFQNTKLEDVLEQTFKHQPLSWSLKGKTIIISKKPASTQDPENNVRMSAPATQSFIEVSGVVKDTEGKPVAGASVVNKTTGKGTSTDDNGMFSLNVNVGDVLVFTSIGYESLSITIKNTSTLSITIERSVSNLNEVIINKGYYTEQRKYSVANVGKVTAKDIEKQPVSNPLLALQGRIPGLIVTQNTGVSGGGVTVRIQGQNSLLRGNDPLFIIDGMPYPSQMLLGISSVIGRSGGNGYSVDGTGNPLNYINPNDIESIEILKDADATAIYGSRAAAGAILITTKKGKAGKTQVDLNMQAGYGKVAHFADLLNTQQYLEMRAEALRNDNAQPGAGDFDINGTWDLNRYTDWQKELIGGDAHYNNIALTVSGGVPSTTFLVGGNYHSESTVFPGNLDNKKISAHTNINHFSANKKFKFQADAKFMNDNNNLPGADLTATAIRLPPNAPALYNADGTINWGRNLSGMSTWLNPLAYLAMKYKSRVNNLMANSNLSYEIIKGLNVKVNLGYHQLRRDEIVLSPWESKAPELRISRSSNFGKDVVTSWNIEPQINYSRVIGKGSLEVLIGSTFLQNKFEQQAISASGFASDLLLEDIKSATSIIVGSSLLSRYNYSALFGRINYNWNNRYIINLTARRDGSSRFGSENLFNNFGSVGAAWIFSNEYFIQKSFPVLSFGKIRGSYGTTGNDQIGDYQFMSLYSSTSRQIPYQGGAELSPGGYTNPYLQWEETKKMDIGLDLGFFKDRLVFSLLYFKNQSSNQLLSYSLPSFTGRGGLSVNFPATIQNYGFELSLNTKNFQTTNFSWTSSINLTIPKNKLVAFDNLANSSYANEYIIGKPFTLIKQFNSLGIDPATGIFIFRDNRGNATSNPNNLSDRYVLANSSPKLYGGLENSIKFKGFTLDVLFQIVKQSGNDYRFGNYPGKFQSVLDRIAIGNQPTTILNRWQKVGDNPTVQKFSSVYSSTINTAYESLIGSNLNWIDISYLRLKNVSLSWQLPAIWKQKLRIHDAGLFIQGQNLWTLTNYVGLDPETGNLSLPPLRTLTAGIKLAF